MADDGKLQGQEDDSKSGVQAWVRVPDDWGSLDVALFIANTARATSDDGESTPGNEVAERFAEFASARRMADKGTNGAQTRPAEPEEQRNLQFDPKAIPVSRIEEMIRRGLAQRYSDKFVVVVDAVGIDIVMRILEKYQRYQTTREHRGFIHVEKKRVGGPVYKIVYEQSFGIEGHEEGGVEGVIARWRSPEVVIRNVEAYLRKYREIDWKRVGCEATVIAYQVLPFGSFYLNSADGNYGEAAISLAGDVAFFTGYGSLAKGVKLAKTLRVVSVATELGVAGTRSTQGVLALRDGDTAKALGYFGEASLMLIGVGTQEIMALRQARSAANSADFLSSSTPSNWDDIARFTFRGVKDMSTWERQIAKWKTILARMKLKFLGGEYVYDGNINTARQLIADLTLATRKEVALLMLPDGSKIIRIGKRSVVDPAGASEIIAHSHSNGFLMLSERMVKNQPADLIQLARRDQTVTYLVGPAGDLVKWTSDSGEWVDDIIGQILVGGR